MNHSRILGHSGMTSRHLQAAEGYAELGMFEEACRELDALPPKERKGAKVLLKRIEILSAMGRYAAAAIARDGVTEHPRCTELHVSGADAIRRAESVEAAFRFLLSACRRMTEEPVFWFKLACYHAKMSNRNDAIDCVHIAVEMDPGMKTLALNDPDPAELREDLECELA